MQKSGDACIQTKVACKQIYGSVTDAVYLFAGHAMHLRVLQVSKDVHISSGTPLSYDFPTPKASEPKNRVDFRNRRHLFP
jgi:hypothetical protein